MSHSSSDRYQDAEQAADTPSAPSTEGNQRDPPTSPEVRNHQPGFGPEIRPAAPDGARELPTLADPDDADGDAGNMTIDTTHSQRPKDPYDGDSDSEEGPKNLDQTNSESASDRARDQEEEDSVEPNAEPDTLFQITDSQLDEETSQPQQDQQGPQQMGILGPSRDPDEPTFPGFA